jgi:Cu2+-exporting ATPase
VVAGSLNLGAPVVARIERLGADTRCEQIAALMRDALTRRPTATRLADRIAGPFLAAVLLLAIAAAVVWWTIDPSRAIWVAVSVLIVTCPCALSLAAPSALLAATSALARRGVLLRRVESLEALARVDHLMLDKTGTLTQARPQFHASQAIGGCDEAPRDQLMRDAVALARALVEALPEGTAHAAQWREVHEVRGLGLEAIDAAGRRWRLGAARWLGVAPGDALADAALVFGPVGRPLLAFSFDECLREDAQAAVRALRAQGVALTVLSGDEPVRVARLAERLGIDHAVAGATPERKLEVLRGLQSRGRVVAMVGDGINDAPVLAQADVSFALVQGAQVARAAADAVLLSGRLQDVAHAVHMGRLAVRVIRQNLVWAALYNAACVPLALAGWLPPWAAGLGMAASSALVVANAMRLARIE